jgi:hypothetical protein
MNIIFTKILQRQRLAHVYDLQYRANACAGLENDHGA